MDLSPRAVIAGRYRVDTKVGAGGMGEVWAGEHIGIGVRVAVKTLLPAAAVNTEVVARFHREAYLLGRIRSDHVARVVDFVKDDVYGLVLVMEFVEGDSLSRILQEKTLDVEETIELGVGIASALKDLHAANIIHRDLKPGNIIMTPLPDGRRRAVVVDFGVSRMMADKSKDEDEELTGITRADMAVGTIEYMAPEQILNSRNVAPGSDIYAAGAILFRAAAGRHVYGQVQSDAELAQKKLTTESPPLPLTRDDKAAEGLARVVGRMLKRRPSERYKSADEVLADLVPVRDASRATIAELDPTTVDGSRARAAGAPPVAAAPAAAAPVSAPTAPTLASASPATPPPVAADSSVSVTAAHPLGKPEAPRRGVSPLVTIGLVAAALGGGVFLGPRLMAPTAPAVADPPPAPAKPTATAAAAPTATAEAAPAPTASASAEPAPSASASAEPAASASVKPAPTVVPGPMPVVPGPMPKPAATVAPTAAPKPSAAPTAAPAAPTAAPAAPPKPAPVDPTGI